MAVSKSNREDGTRTPTVTEISHDGSPRDNGPSRVEVGGGKIPLLSLGSECIASRGFGGDESMEVHL
jgi:hypothetical protein